MWYYLLITSSRNVVKKMKLIWIMTPPIKVSHIVPICLCSVSPPIVSFSPFFPTWFSLLCTELPPAAASPNLPFLKLYCCHLSLAHKCTFTYKHTWTLWLSTRLRSYLVKCVYHYSTPWARAARAQYFAERLFEGFVPQAHYFSFREYISDKCNPLVI